MKCNSNLSLVSCALKQPAVFIWRMLFIISSGNMRLFVSSYLQSDASKMFQRCIIDMLEDPEIVSTMLMPGERERHIIYQSLMRSYDASSL